MYVVCSCVVCCVTTKLLHYELLLFFVLLFSFNFLLLCSASQWHTWLTYYMFSFSAYRRYKLKSLFTFYFLHFMAVYANNVFKIIHLQWEILVPCLMMLKLVQKLYGTTCQHTPTGRHYWTGLGVWLVVWNHITITPVCMWVKGLLFIKVMWCYRNWPLVSLVSWVPVTRLWERWFWKSSPGQSSF